MIIMIANTVEDVKRLLEEREKAQLESTRANLRVSSMADAQERFEFCQLRCETTLHMAEEAYALLDEDDLDDFETAKEKADKLERVERQHETAIRDWEKQRARLEWESRQAQRTL